MVDIAQNCLNGLVELRQMKVGRRRMILGRCKAADSRIVLNPQFLLVAAQEKSTPPDFQKQINTFQVCTRPRMLEFLEFSFREAVLLVTALPFL